jgi:hypothetical protein
LFSNPKYYMDFVVLTGIRSFHLAKYGLNTTNSMMHWFYDLGMTYPNNKNSGQSPLSQMFSNKCRQNSTRSCAPEKADWAYRLIYI